MTEEIAGQEVELFGIKATLPPGAEPFVYAYAYENDSFFQGERDMDTALCSFEIWPNIAKRGFARIMSSLWSDERDRLYMNGPDDFEPKEYYLACRRKGAWNQIIKAADAAGKGEGDV